MCPNVIMAGMIRLESIFFLARIGSHLNGSILLTGLTGQSR